MNKAYEKYEKQMKAAKSSGKNTKAQQEKILANAQRQQQKRGGKKGNEPVDDAGTSSSNAPQKWSDYTVSFHFPEPTELPPPLMQLIDVDFKYPGELGVGLDVCQEVSRVPRSGHPDGLVLSCTSIAVQLLLLGCCSIMSCSCCRQGTCLVCAGRDDFGLQNINIGIDMGSRIAIAGPNGAGKTTLMNLLSGAALVGCWQCIPSAVCVVVCD